MKKPVILFEEDGSLYDKNGGYISSISEDQYNEPAEVVEAKVANAGESLVGKLAALGYKADDIIKLKAVGVL